MPGYQNQTSSHKEQVRSTLDTLAREGAQSMLISALEQEVEEFLGRARYARAVPGADQGNLRLSSVVSGPGPGQPFR